MDALNADLERAVDRFVATIAAAPADVRMQLILRLTTKLAEIAGVPAQVVIAPTVQSAERRTGLLTRARLWWWRLQAS